MDTTFRTIHQRSQRHYSSPGARNRGSIRFVSNATVNLISPSYSITLKSRHLSLSLFLPRLPPLFLSLLRSLFHSMNLSLFPSLYHSLTCYQFSHLHHVCCASGLAEWMSSPCALPLPTSQQSRKGESGWRHVHRTKSTQESSIEVFNSIHLLWKHSLIIVTF